jgi:hypothetical protein
MKLLIMQSFPASYHFLPLMSKYSPQHLVLNLCNPPSVRDQVSHTYRITGKVIIKFFERRRGKIIIKFFERKQEDKRLNRMEACIPCILICS